MGWEIIHGRPSYINPICVGKLINPCFLGGWCGIPNERPSGPCSNWAVLCSASNDVATWRPWRAGWFYTDTTGIYRVLNRIAVTIGCVNNYVYGHCFSATRIFGMMAWDDWYVLGRVTNYYPDQWLKAFPMPPFQLSSRQPIWKWGPTANWKMMENATTEVGIYMEVS